ncbi:hypothetical protein SELMODRAFT_131657 [Selaginella moellendorffii]|uniref:Pentacotripeptide-repeat region of PRORP domain-containing protein n=1 Tax=Selaginella moellendorffii TaxID=88036 RepID=D8T4D5_SELML|nr:hypothetical protein SELMODRAFT_131657 [Selaginella moellendorffii]
MLKRDDVAWNNMLAAYAQEGNLCKALLTFDLMPQWTVVSWNTLISGYLEHGCADEATKLFDQMPEETRDVVAWNAMISTYGENGSSDEAKKLFDRASERNVISWTSLVTAFALGGQIDRATGAFKRMPGHDSALFDELPMKDVISWNSLLIAFGWRKSKHHLPQNAFDSMPVHVVLTWNALMASYAHCGFLQKAKTVFDEMPVRDSISWNALMAAYARAGHGDVSFHVCRLMYQDGVRPVDVTFTIVLTACSHGGLSKDGLQYFHSICADHNLVPSLDNFCCMIDLLARSGRTGDALELVESMPYLPNEVAWAVLLAGCMTHKDVRHGEIAGKRFCELSPSKGAPYVMLGKHLIS